jgi:hypothetical protein
MFAAGEYFVAALRFSRLHRNPHGARVFRLSSFVDRSAASDMHGADLHRDMLAESERSLDFHRRNFFHRMRSHARAKSGFEIESARISAR